MKIGFYALGEPAGAAIVAGMNFLASAVYSTAPAEVLTHWAAIITALGGSLITLLTCASLCLTIIKKWRDLPVHTPRFIKESRLRKITRLFRTKD